MDAIKVIEDYISDLPRPKAYYTEARFRQASYALWAADDILEMVKSNPETPAVILLEQYARRMEMLCCCRPVIYGQMCFCVAYDIAQDILTKFY